MSVELREPRTPHTQIPKYLYLLKSNKIYCACMNILVSTNLDILVSMGRWRGSWTYLVIPNAVYHTMAFLHIIFCIVLYACSC